MFLAANHSFAETVSIDLTNGNFIGDDAYKIVTSTQAQCTQLDNSGIGRTVWAEVNLNGYSYKECIRYYSAGLLENQTNNRAIAYFSGDVAIVGAKHLHHILTKNHRTKLMKQSLSPQSCIISHIFL